MKRIDLSDVDNIPEIEEWLKLNKSVSVNKIRVFGLFIAVEFVNDSDATVFRLKFGL